MLRTIAFAACSLLAILAAFILIVGLMQLESIWSGAYDPVRDDHWPPGSMPNYYAHITRLMISAALIAVISSIGAALLAPNRNLLRRMEL